MPSPSLPEVLESFVVAAAVARAGRESEFYRAVRFGRFRRLAEGVFIPSRVWADLDSDQRYLVMMHAAARATSRDLLFSHHSAAAMWGLPIVGRWPARPEVTVGSSPSGMSRVAFTARKYPFPASFRRFDGVRVTTLARTCLDVARTTLPLTSLAMIDAARAGRCRDEEVLDLQELASEAASVANARGMARFRTVLDLSVDNSGSPGESVSRLAFHLLGLPMPLLQHPFFDADGLIGYVDFWWPEFALVGEFDGKGKYLRDEMLRGRTTAEVVIEEKLREDRLRALSLRVTRWGWNTALVTEKLGRHLERAGLRPVGRG